MKLGLSKPILYLITRGDSTEVTTRDSPDFDQIIKQVTAAVAAGIDLVQIREKRLSVRVLFELTEQAAALTRGSGTRLLVNDRADVAVGAGADGVHLTTQSIDAGTIRGTFGNEFLIGASTHSLREALSARELGADFIVFGPVFTTRSKEQYGTPVGLEKLGRVTMELKQFPVLALGGVAVENAHACIQAGASGIAGISLFEKPEVIGNVVKTLRDV